MSMRLTVFNGGYTDDDPVPNSTADLVGYGLRNGCTEAEFKLAGALEDMRRLAFKLSQLVYEEGIDNLTSEELSLMDVIIEVTEEKRFKK